MRKIIGINIRECNFKRISRNRIQFFFYNSYYVKVLTQRNVLTPTNRALHEDIKGIREKAHCAQMRVVTHNKKYCH